jgi:hypothetical protein
MNKHGKTYLHHNGGLGQHITVVVGKHLAWKKGQKKIVNRESDINLTER